MLLQAYFDESERKDGILDVAGIAYTAEDAERCKEEWDRLFGKYGGCHMTELSHLEQGRFKRITPEESSRLLEEAIAIINSCAKYAVAVSCDMHEMSALLPTWIRGFESAYPVCCHLAMTLMGELAAQYDDQVAYVFEDGHAHQKFAHRFMSRVLDVPELKSSYRHDSHRFASKQVVTQLQTADMLAWESAKYWDETAFKKKRKMRKSLVALLTNGSMQPDDYDTKRIKLLPLTGEPLRVFCERVAALGLLQLAENEQGQ